MNDYFPPTDTGFGTTRFTYTREQVKIASGIFSRQGRSVPETLKCLLVGGMWENSTDPGVIDSVRDVVLKIERTAKGERFVWGPPTANPDHNPETWCQEGLK